MNKYQQLGYDITRTFLKTIPKDYDSNVSELAQRHLQDSKTVKELCASDSNYMSQAETGAVKALKEWRNN